MVNSSSSLAISCATSPKTPGFGKSYKKILILKNLVNLVEADCECLKIREMDSTVSTPKLIGALFQLFLFPAILFLFVGDWRWTEAWVFSVIFLAMCYGTLVYLYFHDPALLQERFGSPIQETQKPWDKVLLSLFFVEFIVWFAIMPLDARRFHWSPAFPAWLRALGALLQIIATYFVFEAMRENTFAAPVVKMQKERGQKVISTGLYGVVRHPMYAGATLLFIAAPLL